MANIPLNTVITDVQKMVNYGHKANKLARDNALDIMDITWEDNARDKDSCWGPCISDMTLQVNDELMPVIRKPNFSDVTWDVEMEKIPLIVGNEEKDGSPSDLRSITLKEYLSEFHKYTTCDVGDSTMNLMRQSPETKEKDSHVIMSSQCCFLPIEQSKETKFNVALYNYQSRPKDPAVLVIVSTSKGTSAQIIEGTMQKLLFNNYGKKADFLGQRLSDNRKERGVSVQGEMSKKEKQDNVIAIIQVPLKQQNVYTDEDFWDYEDDDCWDDCDGGSDGDWGGGGSSRANVEAVIIKVSEKTVPNCVCGAELVQLPMELCYNDRSSVSCSECGKAITAPKDILWHCPREQYHHHPCGYDLCPDCAMKQLEFNELKGLGSIQRDERFPIRVTLQYYQCTSNGIVTEEIMTQIAQQLAKSQDQADFVGSLVTESNPGRPTEWEEEKNENDPMLAVKALLKKCEMFDDYFEKFVEEEVTDEAAKLLEKDDLRDVISKLGPRVMFWKALQAWKEREFVL